MMYGMSGKVKNPEQDYDIGTIARMDTIPKDTIPNGLNSEWTQSRMGTILNGHHPEWTPSRMDTIPNAHKPEWTLPNEHNPEWAQFRMNMIPNGHHA